jgi:hypothetical protein
LFSKENNDTKKKQYMLFAFEVASRKRAEYKWNFSRGTD